MPFFHRREVESYKTSEVNFHDKIYFTLLGMFYWKIKTVSEDLDYTEPWDPLINFNPTSNCIHYKIHDQLWFALLYAELGFSFNTPIWRQAITWTNAD